MASRSVYVVVGIKYEKTCGNATGYNESKIQKGGGDLERTLRLMKIVDSRNAGIAVPLFTYDGDRDDVYIELRFLSFSCKVP
jgi:hypothetical protein